MSASGDFVIGHAERCGYCIEVEDHTDIDDVEKWGLNSACAWESATDAAVSRMAEVVK